VRPGNLCIANLAGHGEKVVLLRDLRMREKCRSMGLVTSPRCYGTGQGDYHINGLKNAAGLLGADHVLILPEQATKEQVKGQAFLCSIPKIVPEPEIDAESAASKKPQ
jgi:hypothetical protein